MEIKIEGLKSLIKEVLKEEEIIKNSTSEEDLLDRKLKRYFSNYDRRILFNEHNIYKLRVDSEDDIEFFNVNTKKNMMKEVNRIIERGY